MAGLRPAAKDKDRKGGTATEEQDRLGHRHRRPGLARADNQPQAGAALPEQRPQRAQLLPAAAGPFLPVPVIVSKGYELPAFVGETSLVFAVSFSGDTEGAVEAASAAAVEGAHIVVITAGGELGRLARSMWAVPCFAGRQTAISPTTR